MKNIVGIDLGTTFSVLARLDESGKPSVIKADEERILPSCIWAQRGSTGQLRVGGLAKRALGTEPRSVAARFKRHMGSSHALQLEALGRDITPVEASALVLRKLTQEAAKEHGVIDEVVITVPANFAERQRRATIEAGEQAGLKVLNIINEPTAAALAYATQHSVGGTVLVYDMGGGTFDVTIAKINGTDIECLTSEGNIDLGGIDFDNCLAGLVDAIYENTYGQSLRGALGLSHAADERGSTVWQALLLDCENWKRDLSALESVTIEFFKGPHGRIQGEITRAEFETAISNYIAQAEMMVESALDNANLQPRQIDQVLLVGGSTRIPAVRRSIQRMIGKNPLQAVNADEAVALGASIYAGLKSDRSKLSPLQKQRLEKVAVKDVANHYYGTMAVQHDEHLGKQELRVDILIQKDTPLPCSAKETYYTVAEGQNFIRCKVTQSSHEERDPDLVNVLYEEQLGPLPEGRPAGQPVEVTFSYSENQTMEVKFLDVKSGHKVEHVINAPDGSKPKIGLPEFRIE